MRKTFPLILCFLFLSLGCSTLQVNTTGYLNPSNEKPFSKNDKYFVFALEKAVNPILELEVKLKIEKLLSEMGYTVVPSLEGAGWIVPFSYGRTGEESSTAIVPLTTTTTQTYSAYGMDGTYTFGTYTQPSTTYYPVTTTNYGHFLVVSLFNNHAESKKQQKPVTAWRSESYSQGESSDLRSVFNYLLVETFQNFGLDTGKEISHSLYPSDPRVKILQNNYTEK
jgi:hypothetical protein